MHKATASKTRSKDSSKFKYFIYRKNHEKKKFPLTKTKLN